MTDADIADKVYIEPLTVPVVKKLIMEEKPDSILPTLGGQNALNIAMALADEGFLRTQCSYNWDKYRYHQTCRRSFRI